MKFSLNVFNLFSQIIFSFLLSFLLAGAPPCRAASSPSQSPSPRPPSTLTADAATALHLSASSGAWQPLRLSLAPARWIWLPCERTPANTFVLFRKELTLDAVPTRALGWITADSRYRLTVNGRRVQWGPAPCDPRELDADPVDLAPYLKAGRNVIGVEVLFYGYGDGTWPGGKPGLLFFLKIDSSGGKSTLVKSDASWLSRLDRAHPPGSAKRWFLRALQEHFDARLHPDGWDTPSYQPDSQWLPAAELNCASDKPAATQSGGSWSNDSVDRVDPKVSSLRMRQIPLVHEEEIPALRLAESGRVHWSRPTEDWFELRLPGSFQIDRTPVAQAQPENSASSSSASWTLPPTPNPDQGVYATFEFKEQIVGFPYFTIDAPAGTVIELMTQESHDPARTAWLDTHHFCWARFTCREGLNRFETFDYESLRWMQLHVHGATRPVTISAPGVRRRTFPWPHAPQIACSDPALQRLFTASINTLNNSSIETLVDGMGRERQQYSGDGGHQLHAIRYAFGESRICARYLRTFSSGLSADGYFLDCWPAYDRLARVSQKEVDGAFWGPLLDHGVGFNFDCWNHYLETGDKDALAEPWPRLVRFAAYLESRRGPDGLLPVEDLGIPTVWMDHQAYKRPAHKQCSFNLYVAAMYTHALAPIADLFGDTAKAAHYRELGGKILAATVRRFWSPERRIFVDNLPWLASGETPRLSDRTLAMSILFGQCPGGEIAAARDALATCPPEMGLSYPCNAGWRYWALARCGRIDVVLQDLRTRWATMPSVLLNNSLQEDWRAQPDSGSQWSHCPLAPIYVLFQDVAGIRPLEPGFARVQIRPQLGDLDSLDLTTPTPRGPIVFSAKREGNGYTLRMTLPAAVQGELLLPAGSMERGSLVPLTPDHPLGLNRYQIPSGKEVSVNLK